MAGAEFLLPATTKIESHINTKFYEDFLINCHGQAFYAGGPAHNKA